MLLKFTCAVGPTTVKVIVGLPLLSDLVGVDENNQYCNKTDERYQDSRAQSCVDVWDKAPRMEMDINLVINLKIKGKNIIEKIAEILLEEGV